MNKSPPINSPVITTHDIHALLKRGFDALARGRYDEAGACCQKILTAAPKNVEGHFLVGLIANETDDLRVAIHAFGSVTTIDPKHAAGWAQLARNFMKVGKPQRAENAIENAIKVGTKDPIVEDLIGTTFSTLGDQHAAKVWYSRAVKRIPTSPHFNLNLASSLIFLGETEKAEAALDQALKSSPADPHGHWRKSNLRRVKDDEHLKILETLMKRFASDPKALSFVAYAAGKEYEDLGEWNNAYRCFESGAKAKREIVEFDEAAEEEMFNVLRETYTPEWAARDMSGYETEAPIFIVGQPRTGTTLVERIITSHSMVHSAGELQQFRLALRRNVQIDVPKRLSSELVKAAGGVDPAKIGKIYMSSSASMQGNLPRFVDKMPINYLFVPMIIKALPNAKIIHLVRDPMDSCFSNFKQLFAEAYFHSYTLEEMARHHVRYHHLMAYWRDLFPGKFLDVKYEEVVSDLEQNARRIIDHLELPWEDACLEFHQQDQAVTTASAVQVREKVHTRSVERWKQYENQMEPVLKILREASVVT